MKFEISKKEVIEKVIFDKDNFYKLFDDYLECDGGIIVKIYDRDMIKKDYIEMGFSEKEMLFYYDKGFGEFVDKDINDVVCKLDIRDRSGGYSVFYDENGNYLIEE
jgi:hypothetical protein